MHAFRNDKVKVCKRNRARLAVTFHDLAYPKLALANFREFYVEPEGSAQMVQAIF
jgi:hypothetical protein